MTTPRVEPTPAGDDWRGFFAAAQIILGAAERADRQLRLRLGSGFNLFSLIGPNENTLSDLLRDLLDPAGTHGQGAAFLKLALEHLMPTPDRDANSTLEGCVVTREMGTPTGKRIDLVIEFNDCWIGIENKPSAAEQPDQLTNYAKHLSSRFAGRFCLVFLYGKGVVATSLGAEYKKELKSEERFLEVPYYAASGRSLYDWLGRCASVAHSEKVRYFLNDFASHVASVHGAGEEAS